MSKLKDVLAAHGESVQRLGDVAVTAVEQLTEMTELVELIPVIHFGTRWLYPRSKHCIVWSEERLGALYTGPSLLAALKVLVEGKAP